MKAKGPPKRPDATLHNRRRIWVGSFGEPISHAATEKVRRGVQRERELRITGKLGKPRAKAENCL
jgi:hypothetical protein